MHISKLTLIFFVGLISALVFHGEKAYALSTEERIINDSLVQNLECRDLNLDKIYNSIRDDAFDVSKNIPVKNWRFRSGLYDLGACWGLSSTQRKLFYLARYNQKSALTLEQRVIDTLDMIRGWKLEDNGYNPDTNSSFNATAVNYNLISVEEPDFFTGKMATNSLWNSLEFGYVQSFSGTKMVRNFQHEVQASQEEHFFRPQNLKMVMKERERPVSVNRQTAALLRKNLDGKRLTLVVIRAARDSQHVVMAKSYKITPEGVMEIKVYDANSPYIDQILYYDSKSGVFYAPNIMSKSIKYDKQSLGVFIVDEKERGPLEKAMLDYYQSLCR